MTSLSRLPPPDLTGRVAAVTGAGRGIGWETCALLRDAGATVIAGLHGAGCDVPPGCDGRPLDVTSAAEVETFFGHVGRQYGGLDILINNAGVIAPIGHVDRIDPDGFGHAFDVNIVGCLRCIQAALPMLAARKGVVVNAGTGAAHRPLEGWAAYCASKAGAAMLARVADLELRPRGLRVFVLGIPPTDTDMQGAIRASGLNEVSQIPAAALVEPGIPASALVWLAGPEARAIDDVVLDLREERFAALMGR